MAEPYLHTWLDHFLERVQPRLYVYCDPAELATNAPGAGWLLSFRDLPIRGVETTPRPRRMTCSRWSSQSKRRLKAIDAATAGL